MDSAYEQTDVKGFGYEIFIALVSILSIFNLVLAFIPGFDSDAVSVVDIINLFLTVIFVIDFGYRISTAQSRSYYFIHNYGWADLLACVTIFRFLKLFRVFKTYQYIRKHGVSDVIGFISYRRAELVVYVLVFIVIIVLEVGSFFILHAESRAPAANIVTAGDALWWAYVTITTVGYGDKYPVTGIGRIIGVVVLTCGVAIFATFSGYISNKLLFRPLKDQDERFQEHILDFEKTILSRIDEFQSSMVQQERSDVDISARLDKIERLLEQGKQDASVKPGEQSSGSLPDENFSRQVP